VRPHNVDCFVDTAAAGDDVFCDDELFVRPNLKTASQNKSAVFFFHEDVAFPGRRDDFLADNDSTEGGRDNRVARDGAELIGEPPANVSGDVGVLEEQGALEELPAVEAGAQYEMAVKQRSEMLIFCTAAPPKRIGRLRATVR
jgi:hypothetical protein